MNRYWLIWFVVTFPLGFLIPEAWALATGHPENTLSAAIWRLENLTPGRALWPWEWTAGHLLFTGVFILIVVWLIGHFGWGLWR